MPALSLVVCLHREQEHLQRLLEHSAGCHDDLIVVHDGPDVDGIRALVVASGGRFFERPRAFQQEPHWPFAWAQARNDWILRLDADEVPSEPLRDWLRGFREAEDPERDVSGYRCIYPLWDGKAARSRRWPMRTFLINRQRVRYFGMADQTPIPDGRVLDLDLVLHHWPDRPSYGFWYTLIRATTRRWQWEIARSLLGRPTDLACWRWSSPDWPAHWEAVRRHPLRTGLRRLFSTPWTNAIDMIRRGEWPTPAKLATSPLQHWMTCYRYRQLRSAQRKDHGDAGQR